MHLFVLYCKNFSCEHAQKADNKVAGAWEFFENVLVAFLFIEFGDLQRGCPEVVTSLLERAARAYAAKSVLIYPYAFSSPQRAPPHEVATLVSRVAKSLENRGFKVFRVPYGRCRRFMLETSMYLGLPLSFRTLTLGFSRR